MIHGLQVVEGTIVTGGEGWDDPEPGVCASATGMTAKPN